MEPFTTVSLVRAQRGWVRPRWVYQQQKRHYGAISPSQIATRFSFDQRCHLSTRSMATSAAKQKFFLTHKRQYGCIHDDPNPSSEILQWYIARDKDVTPIHPTSSELEGRKTVKSIDELPFPKETALSIITPAKITSKLLEQARAQGIPAIWIQPGASDRDCVQYIVDNEMVDYVLWEGECLWRDGDGVLRSMAQERAAM